MAEQVVIEFGAKDVEGERRDRSWALLSTEPSQELFDRGSAALLAHNPSLHAKLTGYRPLSTLEVGENGDLNICFQGTRLYRQGALADSRAQLDRYWNAPDRVGVGIQDSNSMDSQANDCVYQIITRALEEGIEFGNGYSVGNAAFLICFGIGLGAHLPELRETTNCSLLVLIEPNLEFLYHSLFVFDWSTFLAHAADCGTRVVLHVTADPRIMAEYLPSLMRGENPAALDGTYVFQHFDNSVFAEARKILNKEMKAAVAGLGFINDEVLMMRHTFQNLAGGKARVMRGVPRMRRATPVIVVASGPSLDNSFEYLKALQDKAVIVAAGSAIDPLLVHGIRPHFHVLLENEPNTAPFERVAARFDLSGICLVCSATVVPRLLDLYDEQVLFFRPALSPTPAFGSFVGNEVPAGCDPAVSNAALAFAAAMGFRTIYLCGMDLGKPVGAHHHSRFASIPPEDIELTRTYNIPVPGNFGGTVNTDWFLDWTRTCTERLIGSLPGRSVYNCSEGVMIRGALAKRIKSVTIPPGPVTPDRVAREIIDECPVYTRERLKESWDRLNLSNATDDLLDGLAENLANSTDIAEGGWMTPVMQKLTPGRNIDCIATFYRGSIYQIIIALRFYRLRLATPDKTAQLHAICVEEFRRSMDALKIHGHELADELEEYAGFEQ